MDTDQTILKPMNEDELDTPHALMISVILAKVG